MGRPRGSTTEIEATGTWRLHMLGALAIVACDWRAAPAETSFDHPYAPASVGDEWVYSSGQGGAGSGGAWMESSDRIVAVHRHGQRLVARVRSEVVGNPGAGNERDLVIVGLGVSPEIGTMQSAVGPVTTRVAEGVYLPRELTAGMTWNWRQEIDAPGSTMRVEARCEVIGPTQVGTPAGQFAAVHWRLTYPSAFEVGMSQWVEARPLYDAVTSWVVYHFHDTSNLAPMRRDGPIEDSQVLRPIADNLAAFLHELRDQHPRRYQRIRDTVQSVAPFFDDFMLTAKPSGESTKVRLDWRQKGSDFPFQPWQLSDGTIRFVALATALLQPRPPALMVIDEPELGLHPAALSVLAGLFHEASAHTQIIVSTQSPLLVDHFEPDDVVVVRRDGAASHFERQSATELQQWLADYTLGELIRKNVIETGP